MNLTELLTRLLPKEVPLSHQLLIPQDLALAVTEDFLKKGGREALEKNEHRQSYPRIIRNGSYANVYRFYFEGIEYAIKEAKRGESPLGYCLKQLNGQNLLDSHNYPNYAPHNLDPIADRYLVQHWIGGTPSYNTQIQIQINVDLAKYGLRIADPKANAILSPNYKKPVLVDFSEITTTQYQGLY